MRLKIYNETGFMIGYLNIDNDTDIVTKNLHYRFGTPDDVVENLWSKAIDDLLNENPYLSILAVDRTPDSYHPGYVRERRYFAETGTYHFEPCPEGERIIN